MMRGLPSGSFNVSTRNPRYAQCHIANVFCEFIYFGSRHIQVSVLTQNSVRANFVPPVSRGETLFLVRVITHQPIMH